MTLALEEWVLLNDGRWHAVVGDDMTACRIDLLDQDVLDEREAPVRRDHECRYCVEALANR